MIDFPAGDLPKSINAIPSGRVTSYDYDGDRDRVRKTTSDQVTMYGGGLYELVTSKVGDPVQHRYQVHAAGRVVTVVTQRPTETTARYVRADRLGSVQRRVR